MTDFKDRGVVLTGACGVHGRWIAQAFARAGARLCLTDRDGAALDRLLAECAPAAGSFAHPCDLLDDAALAAFATQVGSRWGAADVLVNNAGIYPSGFLLDIDAAEWDRILDLNLRVPWPLSGR